MRKMFLTLLFFSSVTSAQLPELLSPPHDVIHKAESFLIWANNSSWEKTISYCLTI